MKQRQRSVFSGQPGVNPAHLQLRMYYYELSFMKLKIRIGFRQKIAL